MENENKVYSQVFMWMFIGLLVTFLTGFYTASNKDAIEVIFSSGTFWIFPVLEIVLAIFLSARIMKMSGSTAKFVYLLYTFLTGLTFSSIFIAYKIESIIWVFLITSVLFLIFALIGMFTKLNLRKLGTYLFMGLIGVILCSIINIFVGSETFDLGLTILSIIIFVGYVAFDIKRVKELEGIVPEENLAILGAFELYLDFINLFVDLLRLFAENRD